MKSTDKKINTSAIIAALGVVVAMIVVAGLVYRVQMA